MELLRDIIEWIGNDSATFVITLGPFLLAGLVGLYVLWLVIGYLRVSQVGLRDGQGPQQAVALPSGEEAKERPRGVPYCSYDGLQYPPGARYCTKCERDLLLDCTNCGATLSAGDASCYRCGTPTGAGAPALIG
jgi:double zinc ribbon protein